MARSRNIKPAFFDNDELGELEPLARLLFIGLWTLADYNGSLEWREKRIKAQLLPYDECEIKVLAINLDRSGFIRFYSDGDSIYLNIVNFSKHQNPHKNERERGSDIPAYNETMRQAIDFKGLTINRDLSGSERNEDGTDPADSLIPYPDSLIQNPVIKKPSAIDESMVLLIDRILDLYMEIIKPQCHVNGFFKESFKKDKKRMTQLVARIKEKEAHSDIEFWTDYFKKCTTVEWIRDGINGNPTCTIDMLFNKTKFYNFVERFYAS